MKETGRHYSGVSMLRRVRREKSDAGLSIPKGSIVSISPYLTHHDPETWDRPDEWYPERWINDEYLLRRLNDQQIRYMPFGAGSHKCPGEKMAILIASRVIATIVRKTEINWGQAGSEQVTIDLDFSKIGSPWLKGDAMVKFSLKV